MRQSIYRGRVHIDNRLQCDRTQIQDLGRRRAIDASSLRAWARRVRCSRLTAEGLGEVDHQSRATCSASAKPP